ncbi:MAG: prepilin-type N-terminal cleavage/methylation domain-containing protein [Patescibacteria group bacterium]
MNKNTQKGFTLIEVLVSLGIFTIVVVAACGVILSIISSNKKNQAISSVVNNLNYAIESMIRDISTGYSYQCDIDIDSEYAVISNYKNLPPTCVGTTPQNNITLVSTITKTEQLVRYELVGTGADAFIQKTVYSDDAGNMALESYPLTDKKNVSIDKLAFTIQTPPSLTKAGGGTAGQPSVFLIVKGTAKVNQINISDFFIQTFISQRLPNFI